MNPLTDTVCHYQIFDQSIKGKVLERIRTDNSHDCLLYSRGDQGVLSMDGIPFC